MSALFVFIGACLCIGSGLMALFRTRHLPAGIHVLGSLIGLIGCALGFRGTPGTLALPWGIPAGEIAIRVDALSAFFAAPVFLLAGVGAIYAEAYWPSSQPRAAYVRCFFGVLSGALALVLVMIGSGGGRRGKRHDQRGGWRIHVGADLRLGRRTLPVRVFQQLVARGVGLHRPGEIEALEAVAHRQRRRHGRGRQRGRLVRRRDGIVRRQAPTAGCDEACKTTGQECAS